VGRVDEVDAVFPGAGHDVPGFSDVGLIGKHHGAQAQARHFKIAASESTVLHGWVSLVRSERVFTRRGVQAFGRGSDQVLMAWATGAPPSAGTSSTSPAVSRPVLCTAANALTPPGGVLRRKLMLRLAVTASGLPVAPTTAA